MWLALFRDSFRQEVSVVWLDETWTDQAIGDLYRELRKVSERYAREIRWTG